MRIPGVSNRHAGNSTSVWKSTQLLAFPGPQQRRRRSRGCQKVFLCGPGKGGATKRPSPRKPGDLGGARSGQNAGHHVCTARPGTTARPCLAGADGVQRPALSPSSSETARPVRALLRFSVNYSVAPVTLRFSLVRFHTALNSFASDCTGVEPRRGNRSRVPKGKPHLPAARGHEVALHRRVVVVEHVAAKELQGQCAPVEA